MKPLNNSWLFYEPPTPPETIESKENSEHSDSEIVDVLFSDFPKVGEQILEYLDNQNR